MNIFVGNIFFGASEEDLKKAFEPYGAVSLVTIVKEKNGTKSRGFGFVDMPNDQEAQAAIGALNGKDFMGLALNVSVARPKTKEEREAEIKKRKLDKLLARRQAKPKKEAPQNDAWFSRVFNKEGGYKSGRRTRSFVKTALAEGRKIRTKPRRKAQQNSLRWRKPASKPGSWSKSDNKPARFDKPKL